MESWRSAKTLDLSWTDDLVYEEQMENAGNSWLFESRRNHWGRKENAPTSRFYTGLFNERFPFSVIGELYDYRARKEYLRTCFNKVK